MAEQGIVGRGILLDFHAWRAAQDPPPPYDPFERGSIPLKDLLAIAKAQNTEVMFGDILIIRTGIFQFQSLRHSSVVKQSLTCGRIHVGLRPEITSRLVDIQKG